MASPDHAATARAFHEAYERLAPAFGYETRPESAVPWDDVPEQNRALMVAVVTEVVGPLVAALAQAEHERDEARKHANKLGRELDEQGDELERAERQRDRAIEALREILMAEPDDPASPDGKTAWPSFAGRLQAIAGDVLANIEKDTAS